MGRVYVEVREVAERLGVSRARAYQLVAAGVLPHVRRGRRVLVPEHAWQRWCEAEADRAMEAVHEESGAA